MVFRFVWNVQKYLKCILILRENGNYLVSFWGVRLRYVLDRSATEKSVAQTRGVCNVMRICPFLSTHLLSQQWISYQFTCLQAMEFLKDKENFISLLFKHLGTSAIMDLTLKLITEVGDANHRESLLDVSFIRINYLYLFITFINCYDSIGKLLIGQ